MADSVKESCKNYFKYELKAARELQDVADKIEVGEVTPGEVESTMGDVVEEILSKNEDPTTSKRVYVMVAELGRRLESQEMVEFGTNKLKEWEAKHGDE